MAGVVHIPGHAPPSRADKLPAAGSEAAAASIRYGATEYKVHRSRDDQYRVLQMVWFASRLDWERYWDGPEMLALRVNHMGQYQVPVLYTWNDELAADAIEPSPAGDGAATTAV